MRHMSEVLETRKAVNELVAMLVRASGDTEIVNELQGRINEVLRDSERSNLANEVTIMAVGELRTEAEGNA